MFRSVTEYGEMIEKFYPKRIRRETLWENMTKIPSLRDRSDRVYDCGNWLEFAHEFDSQGNVDEKGKLHRASFCRDRLCPMCNWRRRLKIYSQVKAITDNMEGYRYIFLTLTVPNVPDHSLSLCMDYMQQAFKLMFHPRDGRCRDFVEGYIRTMEITYNSQRNDYHPHFHVVLAVRASYFTGRNYKKKKWWIDTWGECWKDVGCTLPPSGLSVDVRVVKPAADGSINSAICEITKYAVKDSDFLTETNNPLKLHVLETIALAVKGRRLFTLGGIFRQVWAELSLDDTEDGDLIHVLEEETITSPIFLVLHYSWAGKGKGYVLRWGSESERQDESR